MVQDGHVHLQQHGSEVADELMSKLSFIYPAVRWHLLSPAAGRLGRLFVRLSVQGRGISVDAVDRGVGALIKTGEKPLRGRARFVLVVLVRHGGGDPRMCPACRAPRACIIMCRIGRKCCPIFVSEPWARELYRQKSW